MYLFSASVVPAAMLTQVLDVKWHSRSAKDFYAATAALDFLSFVYAVLSYQVPCLCCVVMMPSLPKLQLSYCAEAAHRLQRSSSASHCFEHQQ